MWYAEKGKERLLCMVPINNSEIIVQRSGQWFRLHRMDKYIESSVNWKAQLDGEWKFTQFLALNSDVSVDEKVVSEYYTKNITLLDIEEYVEGAVTDWKIENCVLSDLNKKVGRCEYFDYVFSEDDIIHIANRKVYDREETFIIINHRKMIYSGNGVLFIIEKFN